MRLLVESLEVLNRLRDHVHEVASNKGFHDPDMEVQGMARYVANLHAEASELWEATRAGRLHEPCDKADKMVAVGIAPLTCAEEELADIVIRVLDTAKILGVDIGRAVALKDAYNQTRSHRHGGKSA